MKKKLHIIKDQKQFILMFLAGYGQFHIYSKKSGKFFNIRFQKIIHTTNQSRVDVCFGDPVQALTYVKFGKYDFKSKTFQLAPSTDNISRGWFDMLYQNFFYFLNRVNKGESFPKDLEFYYPGICARCGKNLENAKYLSEGFGKECLKEYKIELREHQFDLL